MSHATAEFAATPPAAETTLPSGQVLAARALPDPVPGGEPAVMIHGLGGSSLNWTDLAFELGGRLACEAVDLPGFGFSPPPADGDYSLAAAMSAVAEFIRARYAQPVHLFGNSLGGAVALQLAARHEGLVKTLCLISPALPEWRPRARNVHLPVMTLPRVGGLMFDRFQTVQPSQRVAATFQLCYADPARLVDHRREEAEQEARRRDGQPHTREAYLGSIRGLLASYVDRGEERPWKLAERITAPTLLIYGREDKLVNPAAAHRSHKAFPHSTVVVIPDSGHISQMEHPRLVADTWERFLGPFVGR
ncbi:MAG: alpha/beta fold hydrolase [Candidatus Nanopelagicales bacterium]